MSLLSNQDYVIHRLRTRYLNSMRDGIGERLITLNPTVFNVPGYKNAGWPNAADLTNTQTYSPPIPAGSSMDYFATVPRLREMTPQREEEDENADAQKTVKNQPVLQTGSLDLPAVLGKKANSDKAPGAGSVDDDSSDMSDESDVDDDLNRAAQQIKFSKMPIRQRAGSSPTRSSNIQLMVTSPGKTTETRLRSGSHGTMELEKRKSLGRREDSVTMEILSHTIDQNTKAFKEIAQQLRRSPVSSFRHSPSPAGNDFDSEEDSDDDASSTLSSDFTETGDSHPTILSNSSMSPAPVAPLFSNLDDKASEIANGLDPLPPPRPISQLLPVSALTQLIKANEEEISHPLDAYTVFSGKGDLKAGAPTTANPRRHGPQRDAGGGGGGPLRLKIYRPTSKKPSTPWEVIVKRFVVKDGKDQEVTVADTIGYALYRYREEERDPPLTEDQYSINRWTFRIVEDDGEPDYDFPALDRTRAISAFSLDELALVEATQAQYEEYEKQFPTKKVEKEEEQKEKKPEIKPSTDLASTTEKVTTRTADAPVPTSQSSARTGAPQTLKIYVNTPEVFDQSVTVRVTSDTYNAEVLDIICRKKHLDRSRHTLRIPKLHTIVPLDRTVESLQGRTELELVVKRFIDFVGERPNSPSTTTDPNTPLFAGKSSGKGKPTLLSQTANTSDMLLGAGYQKFTVWRKMPMSFISRHERILAIDGEYVHIMPSDSNKTLFESPKTTSIHISALIGCKASRKAPTNFKLIVMKSREWKRYVFEASSAQQAAEIVVALKTKLMDYKKSTSF